MSVANLICAKIGFNFMKNPIRTFGVTGAAGFIGSNLVKALIDKNYTVVGADNLNKGAKKNLQQFIKNPKLTFIKQDVLNLPELAKAFKGASIIIHLAASKIPRYGDRAKTLLENTQGTHNILEVARQNRAKVIFASTSDVYGKNPKLPFTEDNDLVLGSPEVARWAYAVSKIFDEHLCFAYWEKHKVPFVILRLFGVYGPRQHRSWWGGPQSVFIDNILKGETIEIHGSGRQTRTFTYVDDVVEAIIAALESKKALQKIINIGSTQEISIIDFAKRIAKLAGIKARFKKVSYASFTGEKYEDVERRIPSIELAKKLLMWEPKTNLDVGLEKTINWHRENL